MNTMLLVQDGDPLGALRDFLQRLLERQIVEALYVPMEADGGTIMPALVSDPRQLKRANPLAPVMPINGARAVAALTGKAAPAKLGAVLRACELRALVELAKLGQADLDGVTLIGVDCPGTFELLDYQPKRGESHAIFEACLEAAEVGTDPHFEELSLREACRMCTLVAPEGAHIQLRLFGVDTSQHILAYIPDELAAPLELTESGNEFAVERDAVIESLVARRVKTRERELAAMRSRLSSNGGIAGLFSACLRCHNCMTACPLCYCKTCLFKTAAFDHPPEHYFEAARRKGVLRLLDDTLLFHMTRLNHMSTSCVSCGMCTSACPVDIPVGTLFSTVGAQTQAVFSYQPGREVGEPLPLVTFQADEWTEIGEER